MSARRKWVFYAGTSGTTETLCEIRWTGEGMDHWWEKESRDLRRCRRCGATLHLEEPKP